MPRRLAQGLGAVPKPDLPDITADEIRVESAFGARPIRVLTYRPVKSDNPVPTIMHLHGGGFVAGATEMKDVENRLLTSELRCAIYSIDYRLAPEGAQSPRSTLAPKLAQLGAAVGGPERWTTGTPSLARLKLGAGRRELELVDLANNRAFGYAKAAVQSRQCSDPCAITAATLRRDRVAMRRTEVCTGHLHMNLANLILEKLNATHCGTSLSRHPLPWQVQIGGTQPTIPSFDCADLISLAAPKSVVVDKRAALMRAGRLDRSIRN